MHTRQRNVIKLAMRAAVVVACAGGAAQLLAQAAQQQQQQQQRQQQQQPGGGQQIDNRVDNRVGGELNGNNQRAPGYPSQQWSLPTPSEVRYARERSGALPSELLINAQQIGPLSPHGAMDAIPAQGEVARAMRARPPVLWGPAYGPQLPIPGAPALPTPQPGFDDSPDRNAGVTRPGPLDGGVGPEPTGPLPPAGTFIDRRVQSPSLGAGPLSPLQPGTVQTELGTHNYVIRRNIASTQSATQPSLGEEQGK